MRSFPRTLLVCVLLFPFATTGARVYRDRIQPHWAADGSHFWYRNDLPMGQREFVLVDLAKGTRKRAFDHQRLAQSLGKSGAGNVEAAKLPLDDLRFDLRGNSVKFRANGKHYRCDLKSYAVTQIEKPADPPKPEEKKPSPSKKAKKKEYQVSRDVSPDGKWRAYIKDHNVFVRAAEGENTEEIQLSKDGEEKNRYDAPFGEVSTRWTSPTSPGCTRKAIRVFEFAAQKGAS